MIKATSSPIRVSRCFGKVFFEICGAIEYDDQVFCGFSVSHRDYETAKKMFWDEFKELHPNVYLNARESQ